MDLVLRQLSLPRNIPRDREFAKSFFEQGIAREKNGPPNLLQHLSLPKKLPGDHSFKKPCLDQGVTDERDCSAHVVPAIHVCEDLSRQEEQNPNVIPSPRPQLPQPALAVECRIQSDADDEAAKTADELYRQKHAILVKRGLRYVNAPQGRLRGHRDDGMDAPQRILHGTPVRIMAQSGSHCKVVHENSIEAVWIPSTFLVTEPPRRFAPIRHSPRAAPAVDPTRPPISRVRRHDEESEAVIDESLLPEDAPPGHAAHLKVKFNSTHVNPLVSFRYAGVPFQTTVAAAGSRRAAEVIARACWMRFERGEAKDTILRFRNECYDKVNPLGASPAKKCKPEPHPEPPASSESLTSEVGVECDS